MPGEYEILAGVYDKIGMGTFARDMTPRLLDYAQRHGWMGRQIIDLGCGAGLGLQWLAQHGYLLTAVDESPEMLKIARDNLEATNLNVRWLEQSAQSLDLPDSLDMALSFNVLNEPVNLKDLNTIFQATYKMLRSDRLFMFDMHTIEGLIERNQHDQIIHEDENLMVFGSNNYDYDRQIQTRRYIIFTKQANNWQQQEATRTLRSYPVQAVRGMLSRSGFDKIEILRTDLSNYDGKTGTDRVIFVAWKQ